MAQHGPGRPAPIPVEGEYVSPGTLKGILGVSHSTLARWRRLGCPHVGNRPGVGVRYRWRDVRAWLSEEPSR